MTIRFNGANEIKGDAWGVACEIYLEKMGKGKFLFRLGEIEPKQHAQWIAVVMSHSADVADCVIEWLGVK